MRNVTIYISQLPEEIQEEILVKITASLTVAGDFTEDNLQRARDGRLSDLDEVLDIGKYAESVPTIKLGQG